uniref:hypothetical protein n=1 Tax=Candidatus Fimenecus sp. TaxID=3022888 RepID=UPI003FEFF100
MENNTNKTQVKTKAEIFGNVFVKALAYLLAFLLTFSVVKLAHSNSSSQAAAVGTQSGSAVNGQSTPQQGNNTQQSNNNSSASSNGDTNAPAAGGSESKNAGTEEQASNGTEEIVKLYNDSVNRVKGEASSITRNYKHMESLPEYLELPSAIQSIGSAAMDQFVKGTDEPQSWSSPDDIKTIFPVSGEDYSSHLTADMVKNASCTEDNGAYKVSIELQNDAITSPQKGEGYAGVFNTVTASTFSEINIPTVTFQTVDVNGINGAIECTIDKNSGRVTEIIFKNTDVLHLGVKVAISNMNVQFALAVEENYTIAY